MRASTESDAIIAIVDDDTSAREGLQSLIRSAGWRVNRVVAAQECSGHRGARLRSWTRNCRG